MADPKEAEVPETDVEVTEEKQDETEVSNENVAQNSNQVEEKMEDISIDSSPDQTGSGTTTRSASEDLQGKVQNIKSWGLGKFMRTKQRMLERLSKTPRTVDMELEDSIESIKVQQIQLRMLHSSIATRTHEHATQDVMVTQSLARLFSDLSCTDKRLAQVYLEMAATENSAAERSRELIGKLDKITKALDTLVSKTFVDLLASVEMYEQTRVEYDAYKTEVARTITALQQQQSSNGQQKLEVLKTDLETRRVRYEASKTSLQEKISLLNENKARVVKRELSELRAAMHQHHLECARLFGTPLSGPQ